MVISRTLKHLVNVRPLTGSLLVILIGLLTLSCRYYGRHKDFGSIKLYYTTNVDITDVELLGDYFTKLGWDGGDAKHFQLDKSGNTYEVRMVIKKGLELDPQTIEESKLRAADISEVLYAGRQVDIHLCDRDFETIRVVPMAR